MKVGEAIFDTTVCVVAQADFVWTVKPTLKMIIYW